MIQFLLIIAAIFVFGPVAIVSLVMMVFVAKEVLVGLLLFWLGLFRVPRAKMPKACREMGESIDRWNS